MCGRWYTTLMLEKEHMLEEMFPFLLFYKGLLKFNKTFIIDWNLSKVFMPSMTAKKTRSFSVWRTSVMPQIIIFFVDSEQLVRQINSYCLVVVVDSLKQNLIDYDKKKNLHIKWIIFKENINNNYIYIGPLKHAGPIWNSCLIRI